MQIKINAGVETVNDAIEMLRQEARVPESYIEMLEEMTDILGDCFEKVEIKVAWFGVDRAAIEQEWTTTLDRDGEKIFTDCAFFSNSPYMKCAVNPEQPCNGCIHFEKN